MNATPFPAFKSPEPAPRHGRFVILSSVQLERGARDVHCRVQLVSMGHNYHGEAHELDSPSGRARAAARATLAAAEQSSEGLSFGLEGVAVVELFSRTYVVASIEAAQNRQFVLLSGMVALDSTRAFEDAAALATLSAIDRWIAG